MLAAVNGQHGAVQIEDGPSRTADPLRTPTVVQLQQSLLSRASEPLQETPQTGGFWIARQTRQVVKDAVVAQRFGGFDPSQAQNQRVEKRLQGRAYTVAVVSLCAPDVPPERTLQADALEELLDQGHTTELCEADAIGRNTQFSRPSGHCSQTQLLVSFRYKRQNSHLRGFQQAIWQFC